MPRPPAKPRKVKDYSDGARKPELRGSAWWSSQDSNQQTNDYEKLCRTLRQLGRPSLMLAPRHFPSAPRRPSRPNEPTGFAAFIRHVTSPTH
jgi:hypothetical protein